MGAALALLVTGRALGRGAPPAARQAAGRAAVRLRRSGEGLGRLGRALSPDRRAAPLGFRRGGVAGAVAPARGLIAFGTSAAEAFVRLGQNQDRTSRWSLPQRAADGSPPHEHLAGTTSTSPARCSWLSSSCALSCSCAQHLGHRDEPGGWIAPGGMGDARAAARDCLARALVRDLAVAARCADRGRAPARRLLALSAYMLVIAVPL